MFHVEQWNQVTKSTIDYHTPEQPRSREYGWWWGMGGAVGCVVTLPAIYLAMVSAGAGHGDYGFARALFPLPMLSTLLTGNSIPIPTIVAAFAQYPLYGVIFGRGIAFKKWRAIVAILVIHLLATWLCFAGIFSNFS